MTFKEAWKLMKNGLKVRRPFMKGYWYIDPLTNKLTIHLKNGKEITEGNLNETLINSFAKDWEAL